MSESRICPVCENEIPEEARYSCRYCGFDLKMLNDEEGIERAKRSTTDYQDGYRKYLLKQDPNLAVGCVVVILVSLCLFYYIFVLGA